MTSLKFELKLGRVSSAENTSFQLLSHIVSGEDFLLKISSSSLTYTQYITDKVTVQ